MRLASLPLSTAQRRPHSINALSGVGVYLLIGVLLWVASGVGVPPAFNGLSVRVQGLITIFLSLFLEALPFIVGGVLLSSLIALFVSDQLIQRIVPKRPLLAALTGTLLGLLFPVCECGTVPTTRRLLQKGAPLPFCVGFLLAAPVINPIVIISTYVAFNGDWLIVGSRVGLTLIIALAVAVILAWLPRQQTLLAARLTAAGPNCACPDHDQDRSFRGILRHSAEELVDMSRWLVMGAFLAATMQTFIPQELLLRIGTGTVSSVVVMMALALVLSVCSTVDAFLALALSTTFGPGALLAFLVFGPMIDVKSGLLFLTTLSPRAVAWIVCLVTPVVFVAGILINLGVR